MKDTKMKTKILMGLGILLIIMGVGYAALSATLTINGTAGIAGEWNVYISNITEKELGNAKTVSTKVDSKTTASFSVDLEKPGSYAEYEVTVKNDGSLDAVLKAINGIDEANAVAPTDIEYSIKDLEVDTPLLIGAEIKFVVRVDFKATATSLPTTTTKNLTLSLDFEQSTGSSVEPTPEEQAAVELIQSKNVEGNTDGLFTDDFSNIRYAGSNSDVKNYVKFNNGIWRIIGIFDGKIKLVSNSSISSLRWAHAGSASSGGYAVRGNNNFPTSFIAGYLNGQYLADMTPESQKMISSTIYHLGGIDDMEITKKESYELERGTSTYTGCVVGKYEETAETCPRATTWTGKIGLMYISDYAYAAGSACNVTLDEYQTTACKNNNWLNSSSQKWFITPDPTIGSDVNQTMTSGGITSAESANEADIYPVLYLNSDVKIVGGDGSSTNAYQLSLKQS